MYGGTFKIESSTENPIRGESRKGLNEKKISENSHKNDRQGNDTRPVRFDWRNVNGENYVSRVKSQGFCNCCSAFSVVSAVEVSARHEMNIPVTLQNEYSVLDLSEQHLFFSSDVYLKNSNCAKGWSIESALEFSKSVGIIPEKIYPYNPYFKSPIVDLPVNWKEKVTKLSGYTSYSDTEKMKIHLSTKGPLVASMSQYFDFAFYGKGIYSHFIDDLIGSHSVCCIGYDDEKEAWLCKNSWGSNWGAGGFFWIKYGDSDIDDMMWGIEGFSQIHIPENY